MYYVLLSVTRADKTTHLYSNSAPDAIGAAAAMSATVKAAAGFVGSHSFGTAAGLNIVNVQVWDQQSSYDAWAAANADAITAYNTARDTYNSANSITAVEVKFTDPAVLF